MKNLVKCPGGCPCPEFDCDLLDPYAESCLDPLTNPNFLFCKNEARESAIACEEACLTPTCISDCWSGYTEDLKNCPCEETCHCKQKFEKKYSNLFSRLPL